VLLGSGNLFTTLGSNGEEHNKTQNTTIEHLVGKQRDPCTLDYIWATPNSKRQNPKIRVGFDSFGLSISNLIML
jgi:hypothetical protein